MPNFIIESISNKGVKTSSINSRLSIPKAGDIIEFPETMQGRYPISDNESRTRIVGVDKETNRIQICGHWGSAFWQDDGELSVSGGPFYAMPVEMLEPKMELGWVDMWNWGDHSPGASQAVEYRVARPVFVAKCHPDDTRVLDGMDEQHARNGGQFRHETIPADWGLMKTIERHTFIFAAPHVMEMLKPVAPTPLV